MGLLGALGAPPGQRRQLPEVSGGCSKGQNEFIRIWRGARLSKLSVCIANNASNADAWSTEPAPPEAA